MTNSKSKKNNLNLKKLTTFINKDKHKKEIISLIKMNNGRKGMREALGMDLNTSTEEAIKKFWLLGEFLELGNPKDNKVKVEKDTIERQEQINKYKTSISDLKKNSKKE